MNQESSILGSAVGFFLEDGDGLRVAYLPPGIGAQVAESIVRAANVRHRERGFADEAGQPLAVLLSDGPERKDDPDCLHLNSSSILKYRLRHRLVVVHGQPPELASFDGSFSEVLGQAFPASNAPQRFDMSDIAKAALASVLERAGLAGFDSSALEKSWQALERCFALVQHVEFSFGQSNTPWNTNWFNCIDQGLSSLAELLITAAATKSGENLSDLIERFSFACFGLPFAHHQRGSTALGKKITEAFDKYWSSEESIILSASQLTHHPDTLTDPHPMKDVTWHKFDQRMAASHNGLDAIQSHAREQPELIEALASLTLRQFLDPSHTAGTKSELMVEDLEGRVLAVDKDVVGCDSFLKSVVAVLESGKRVVLSETVRIRVPLKVTPSEQELEQTQVSIAIEGRSYTWIGGIVGIDGDDLILEGAFSFTLSNSSTPKYSMSARRISVACRSDDPLVNIVDLAAAANVYLMPPQLPSVICIPRRKNGSSGKATAVCAQTLSSTASSDPLDQELDRSYPRYTILALSSGESVTINGRIMPSLKGRVGVHVFDIQPSGVFHLLVDDEPFTLYVPDTTAKFESPILAAIEQQTVDAQEIPPVASETLQGEYERILGKRIFEDDWRRSLGHTAVPTHAEFDLEETDYYSAARIETGRPLSKYFSKFPKFRVSAELAESDEVKQFVQSFSNLAISAKLTAVGPSGPAHFWPSRVSWRFLGEEEGRAALNDYLTAYAQLVQRAKDIGDTYGVFWASYPFSVSIWDETQPFDCSAVLLSPLHPIRLAWVASVEDALWESELAKVLAGTVEGWNLPFFGPGSSQTDRMVAIPSDSGPGQMFLGWSMLVPVPLGSPKPLQAPTQVGRFRVGSSSSGLTGGATTSAIRNYLRLNSHVSTLTVDLAGSVPSSRSVEVDDAVLDEIELWVTNDDSPLPGGVRVWDSLARVGPPPIQRLLNEAQRSPRTPLSWKRYANQQMMPVPCDIRFMGDSSSLVNYRETAGNDRGVLAAVPLRRFEVHSESGDRGFLSETRPGLIEEAGWCELLTAIRAIESSSLGPTIQSELAPQLSDAGTAAWTVSGESFLSPSSMADLLEQSSNGRQMLWEWRPPFLDVAAGEPIKLERKPFISITRVPESFRDEVGALLTRALGTESDELLVSKVLGVLGSRGIGLSSLLAMGGTHASGAIGFYLTLALSSAAVDEDMDTFILPLDACDAFLNALAGDVGMDTPNKRADLLVLRCSGSRLSLVPVEIKSYRLDSKEERPTLLPSCDSGGLNEAVEQLASSTALLRRLAESWNRIRTEGTNADKMLWANGLAALVEAGLKLQPAKSSQHERMRRMFARLLAGDVELQVGKGLIAYFAHQGVTDWDTQGQFGVSHPFGEPERDGSVRAFTANTGAALRDAGRTGSHMSQSWRQLLEWATAVEQGNEPTGTSEGGLNGGLVETSRDKAENEAVVKGPKVTNFPEASNTPEESTMDAATNEARALKGDVRQENLENNGDGVRVSIGKLIDSVGQSDAVFWPGNTALHQMNVGVVGDLGTGKTQLLLALILKIRTQAKMTQDNPVSFLIFDYKGDYQNPDFLEKVGGLVLEPEDIPLNVLSRPGSDSSREAHRRAMEFYDIMQKIYKNLGPVQRQRLSRVLRSLFSSNEGNAPTLGQVLEAYELDAGAPDSISSILSDFVYGGVFSENSDELRSFDELIQDRVLVVNLKGLGTNQQMKNALVVLFLNLYYDYMLRSQKWPFAQGTTIAQVRKLNSFLLVDEATNIMEYEFPVLEQLLLQGREFGFGVILASQYLTHFTTSGTNYAEPLRTWFIHKVPQVTQKQLASLGLPEVSQEAAARIPRLANHHAFYISLGHPGEFVRGYTYFEM